MFRTVPLSIIRSFSLYTQQWYMSYRFADNLRAGSGQNCSSILILLASCQQTCMSYTIAVYTVKSSWWWTEELSETCRVSMLIKKVQLDATICRHSFTAKSLYMFRASRHPSSGALKTVTATSGRGHDTGTATSFQRGPEQTTLEGSSCASIMTYTRGSGYSF